MSECVEINGAPYVVVEYVCDRCWKRMGVEDCGKRHRDCMPWPEPNGLVIAVVRALATREVEKEDGSGPTEELRRPVLPPADMHRTAGQLLAAVLGNGRCFVSEKDWKAADLLVQMGVAVKSAPTGPELSFVDLTLAPGFKSAMHEAEVGVER